MRRPIGRDFIATALRDVETLEHYKQAINLWSRMGCLQAFCVARAARRRGLHGPDPHPPFSEVTAQCANCVQQCVWMCAVPSRPPPDQLNRLQAPPGLCWAHTCLMALCPHVAQACRWHCSSVYLLHYMYSGFWGPCITAVWPLPRQLVAFCPGKQPRPYCLKVGGAAARSCAHLFLLSVLSART